MNAGKGVAGAETTYGSPPLNFCFVLGFMALFPVAAAVAAPDLEVVIQPIQVCLTDGSSPCNPSMALFEVELDKIWAQAGIDVRFLPFNQYWNGSDQNLLLSELSPMVTGGFGPPVVNPPAFFERAGGKNADPLVLNLWFVDSITDPGFGEILGVSNSGIDLTNGAVIWLNGMVVEDRIFDPADPEYPLFDVVAHTT